MRSSEMRLAVSCSSEWPEQTSPAWACWAATTGAACCCGSGSNSALLSSCSRFLTPLSMPLRPSSPVQEEIIQRVQEAVKDGRVESVVMTVRGLRWLLARAPPRCRCRWLSKCTRIVLDCMRASVQLGCCSLAALPGLSPPAPH